MHYTYGQIVAFSLRALYRFGMSFAEKEEDKKKHHLQVMNRHIDFVQECVETLPSVKE